MCFSLSYIEQMLILGVVIFAIVMMLQVLVPWILTRLGAPLGEGWGIVVTCLRIFFWAIVAILVIIFVFMLISCLLSMTGGFHLLPR